jgi:hypothetical protein
MMPTSRPKSYQPSTVANTFEQIRGGINPWVAIGDFLDDWRRSAPLVQQELVATPITAVSRDSPFHCWAVFCAAMVEQLCLEARLAVPEWVSRSEYVLAEPWYLYRGKRPEWRAWQEATSPEPFRKRHIYGGDRILART